MEFTQTMFEYEFDGVTPQKCLTLKAMTVEELYEAVLASIEEFNSLTPGSQFRLKSFKTIQFHVGELFRRNMFCRHLVVLMPNIFDVGYPDSYNPHTVDQTLKSLTSSCKENLDIIKCVKSFMMVQLKAPLLSKQINDLMDEILDKNGNKPSQFKDFLTPDHYRMVRMGCDVSEWSVEEQEVLLACLKKM